MEVRDCLQLIETDLMRHILSLDVDELWLFVVENLDKIKRKEKFETGFFYALPYGMEHTEKNFRRQYDENDGECIKQTLINDLAFIGKQIPVDFRASSGYFDSHLSVGVETSLDIIPEWDKNSEAERYYRRFDVLNAEHIDLIAAAISRPNQSVDGVLELADPGQTVTDALTIKTLAKALRQDPTLRAAYIYQMRFR